MSVACKLAKALQYRAKVGGQISSSAQYLTSEVPRQGGRERITVEARTHAGMRGFGAVCTSGMLVNLRLIL